LLLRSSRRRAGRFREESSRSKLFCLQCRLVRFGQSGVERSPTQSFVRDFKSSCPGCAPRTRSCPGCAPRTRSCPGCAPRTRFCPGCAPRTRSCPGCAPRTRTCPGCAPRTRRCPECAPRTRTCPECAPRTRFCPGCASEPGLSSLDFEHPFPPRVPIPWANFRELTSELSLQCGITGQKGMRQGACSQKNSSPRRNKCTSAVIYLSNPEEGRGGGEGPPLRVDNSMTKSSRTLIARVTPIASIRSAFLLTQSQSSIFRRNSAPL
jgi:hypothetical protein